MFFQRKLIVFAAEAGLAGVVVKDLPEVLDEYDGAGQIDQDTQIRTISHAASAIRPDRFAAIRSASRLVD